FRSGSILNTVYLIKTIDDFVSCEHYDRSLNCPDLGKRIWSDGSFPANKGDRTKNITLPDCVSN
ncbi:MAG: hypothetical protein KDD94_06855, partial [Calditrichaeota bacterium]|nr:hypothetical protein [Calditrichota bacterium]